MMKKATSFTIGLFVLVALCIILAASLFALENNTQCSFKDQTCSFFEISKPEPVERRMVTSLVGIPQEWRLMR